jgi:hypothetical protein
MKRSVAPRELEPVDQDLQPGDEPFTQLGRIGLVCRVTEVNPATQRPSRTGGAPTKEVLPGAEARVVQPARGGWTLSHKECGLRGR